MNNWLFTVKKPVGLNFQMIRSLNFENLYYAIVYLHSIESKNNKLNKNYRREVISTLASVGKLN